MKYFSAVTACVLLAVTPMLASARPQDDAQRPGAGKSSRRSRRAASRASKRRHRSTRVARVVTAPRVTYTSNAAKPMPEPVMPSPTPLPTASFPVLAPENGAAPSAGMPSKVLVALDGVRSATPASTPPPSSDTVAAMSLNRVMSNTMSNIQQPLVAGPSVAPIVTAPSPAVAAPSAKVAPLASIKAAAPIVKPATPGKLSSRHKDQLLLAQLEADLRREEKRLNKADRELEESQRRLASLVTTTLQQAMIEAGADAGGLHPFVRVAQRYAGTPYVWGGESGRGFDCSGFIIRVMRDLGYRALPHSAAEQFNYGQPVAQALLKPGDLVFFANTYKPGISHVGIYLGRRHFIHAAGTKIGTIVSSLDSSRFQAKYAGARRLIPVR